MGKWVVRPAGSWAQGPAAPCVPGDANPWLGGDAEAEGDAGTEVPASRACPAVG